MNFCSDEKKIIEYIENCHLSDGGYSFARVEPSGGLDTCLATKTLVLLGARLQHKESIMSFWEKNDEIVSFFDLDKFYLMAETWKALGLLSKFKKEYLKKIKHYILPENLLNQFSKEPRNNLPRNNDFDFAMLSIALAGKDMEQLYRIISLCDDLGIKIPKKKIAGEILKTENENGGFGSNLLATYYALKIIALACRERLPRRKVEKTRNYLFKLWPKENYLENFFFIIDGLYSIGGPLPPQQAIYEFVCSCQRNNAGFSRARVIGIPTIEYTYYAIKILNILSQRNNM
jgi:hypothetical protein